VLKQSLETLPEGVETVSMRSDSAGYQWDLLRYCAEGHSERFGVIDFAVSADVTPAFRQAVHEVAEKDWHPLQRLVQGRLVDSDQQWAEVCFVPNEAARKKTGPSYRFLAIREPLRQLEISGMESDQAELPFPTISYAESGPPRRFKLFGVVTNRDLAGEELIRWHRQRCGKSEEVHAVMKDDLAGGRLPSKLFGANAAWWGAMILALNLNMLMKRLVLGARWVTKRMKAIRYWIIDLSGRLVDHARQLTLRLSAGHPSAELLIEARRTLAAMATGPSG
ncbi:MAG: IS1380 family transposase, partial [Chloroflexi bacterium]|nr:IS1380 family transposase [Chloroflexota bacterium]